MAREDICEHAAAFILSRDLDELRNLTPESVAGRQGTDVNRLSLLFEEKLGLGLDAFILREKMHRAYFMLCKNFSLTMDEMARLLGFPTVEEFETRFEKYFAIHPRSYRDLMERKHRG